MMLIHNASISLPCCYFLLVSKLVEYLSSAHSMYERSSGLAVHQQMTSVQVLRICLWAERSLVTHGNQVIHPIFLNVVMEQKPVENYGTNLKGLAPTFDSQLTYLVFHLTQFWLCTLATVPA